MTTKTNSVARARVRTALGVIALAALLWSGYEAITLRQLGEALRPGIVSLELAATAGEANAIRREWNCQASTRETCLDVTPVARQVLARDSYFIVAYVTAWVLFGLWAGWTAGVSRRVTGIIAGLIVVGGLCDLAENWLLSITLGSPDQPPFAWVASLVPGLVDHARASADNYRHAVALARLAAMAKFALLLLGVAATLAVAGGALRLILVRRRIEKKVADGECLTRAEDATGPSSGGFSGLIELENLGIFGSAETRSPDHPVVVDHVAADEPRIDFRAADVIGLALSGGGIRSATFNLGLLQGLHRRRLLRLFDYVSTVSGGGYVGSFWSEWLARQAADHGRIAEDRLFPTLRDAGSQPQRVVDTDQERHLREFSGFRNSASGAASPGYTISSRHTGA